MGCKASQESVTVYHTVTRFGAKKVQSLASMYFCNIWRQHEIEGLGIFSCIFSVEDKFLEIGTDLVFSNSPQ